MALPTEISSMNSLAAAWEDGVDALNAAQPGRVIQPDLRYLSCNANTSLTLPVPISSTAVAGIRGRITGPLNKEYIVTAHGVTGGNYILIYLNPNGLHLRMYSSAGFSAGGNSIYYYLGASGVNAFHDVINLTIEVSTIGAVSSIHVRSDSGIDWDVTETTDLSNSSGFAAFGDSFSGGFLEGEVHAAYTAQSAVDIDNWLENKWPTNPYALFPLNDADGSSVYKDFSGNGNDLTSLRDLENSYGVVATTNSQGYVEDLVNYPNNYIEVNADGTVPANWAGGTWEEYPGAVAIDLSAYQIPERYKRFVDAGDGGFFDNSGTLADIDGAMYFNTNKATVSASLPYQQSYAKNLISYDNSGAITTVLLDKNHVDYAADLSALEALAGIGKNIFTANGLPDQQWGAALYNLTGMPTLLEYRLGSGTSVSFQTSVDPADTSYLLLVTPPGCRGIQFIFNPQNSTTFTASPEYYLNSNGDRIYDPAVHTLNPNISVDLEPSTPVVTLPANTVTAGVDVARLAMHMYQYPIGIEKLVYGADPGNFIEYTDFLQVLDLGDSQLQAAGENASLSSFVIQKNGAPISPTAEFVPAIREIVTGGGTGGVVDINPQAIWEYADRTITGYANPSNRKSVNDKLDDFLSGTNENN